MAHPDWVAEFNKQMNDKRLTELPATLKPATRAALGYYSFIAWNMPYETYRLIIDNLDSLTSLPLVVLRQLTEVILGIEPDRFSTVCNKYPEAKSLDDYGAIVDDMATVQLDIEEICAPIREATIAKIATRLKISHGVPDSKKIIAMP